MTAIKSPMNVRTVTCVTLPADGYGRLQPPHRPWSTPAVRRVRLHLSAGATDWSLDALTAAANICAGGTDVMIESDNAVLAANFGEALANRLRELNSAGEVA